jgi:hypothetical protein
MGEHAESEGQRPGFLNFIKKPLVIIIIAGLVIRGILFPLFTYNYDISFWATTIQHIQSGNGLFSLPGYYYTPVWGYFLGFMGLIATYVFRIASFGTIGGDLLPSFGADWEFYGTMVVSPEFSIFVKSFITIFDLLCAYLIYVIVKRFKHSDREATIAFGLWFLCPLVIYTSAIQATFDSISIAFMLLTLVLIIDRRYAFAGASLATAALTKFFPAYLAFIFLAYILKKNQDKISRAKSVLLASIGAVVASTIILLPQILSGTLPQAFGFVSDRVSWAEDVAQSSWESIETIGIFVVMILQLLIFALLIMIAYKAYKTDDSKFDKTFMLLLMISSVLVFLWTPAPTYLLITIPFLAYIVATAKSKQQKRYIWPLVLISITATAYSITMHSYSVLFQGSIYFDLVSADTILNGIEWLNHAIVPGFTRQTLLNVIMGAAETFAIYSVFAIYIYNWRETKVQNGAVT